MDRHILLQNAFIYENTKKDEDLKPKNCIYDHKNGFWRVKDSHEVMMISDFAERPETKKCDIETGEDQKGE